MQLLELDTPLPHAEHLFGTRGDDDAQDIDAVVRAHTEVIGPIAHMRQVHGDRIAYATEPRLYEEADALFTDHPDLWLAVKTADCVPVLVSCPEAVAAVHCGWRGLEAGLLPKTIQLLMDEFHVSAGDVFLHVGPCIRQHNYEVEESFTKKFDDHFFRPAEAEGKVLLDLAGLVHHQAYEAGVPDINRHDSGLCTFDETDLLYSYRRAKAAGKAGYQVQLSLVRRAEV